MHSNKINQPSDTHAQIKNLENAKESRRVVYDKKGQMKVGRRFIVWLQSKLPGYEKGWKFLSRKINKEYSDITKSWQTLVENAKQGGTVDKTVIKLIRDQATKHRETVSTVNKNVNVQKVLGIKQKKSEKANSIIDDQQINEMKTIENETTNLENYLSACNDWNQIELRDLPGCFQFFKDLEKVDLGQFKEIFDQKKNEFLQRVDQKMNEIEENLEAKGKEKQALKSTADEATKVAVKWYGAITDVNKPNCDIESITTAYEESKENLSDLLEGFKRIQENLESLVGESEGGSQFSEKVDALIAELDKKTPRLEKLSDLPRGELKTLSYFEKNPLPAQRELIDRLNQQLTKAPQGKKAALQKELDVAVEAYSQLQKKWIEQKINMASTVEEILKLQINLADMDKDEALVSQLMKAQKFDEDKKGKLDDYCQRLGLGIDSEIVTKEQLEEKLLKGQLEIVQDRTLTDETRQKLSNNLQKIAKKAEKLMGQRDIVRAAEARLRANPDSKEGVIRALLDKKENFFSQIHQEAARLEQLKIVRRALSDSNAKLSEQQLLEDDLEDLRVQKEKLDGYKEQLAA